MTKQQAIKGALRFLQNVFKDDIDAIATIINAEAENDTKTIIKSLRSVKNFCNACIKAIKDEDSTV